MQHERYVLERHADLLSAEMTNVLTRQGTNIPVFDEQLAEPWLDETVGVT